MRSRVHLEQFRIYYIASKWMDLQTNYELKVTNPFNMQSEFAALQGASYMT